MTMKIPVKVAANEVVDLLLGDGMTILKLVQSGELLYVQSVRRHDIYHALQTHDINIARTAAHTTRV